MNELIYITNSKLDFPGPNIIYINDNLSRKLDILLVKSLEKHQEFYKAKIQIEKL